MLTKSVTAKCSAGKNTCHAAKKNINSFVRHNRYFL